MFFKRGAPGTIPGKSVSRIQIQGHSDLKFQRQQLRVSRLKGKPEGKQEKLYMDLIIVDQKLVEGWSDFCCQGLILQERGTC